MAADRIVAGGALRAARRATAGRRRSCRRTRSRRATAEPSLTAPAGQVVHVLERRLAGRDRRVDGGLGLAAAVAGLADVVVARLLARRRPTGRSPTGPPRSPRSRSRACRGRCRTRGRWRSPGPPCRRRTGRRSGSPSAPPWHDEQVASTCSPWSQWRAASLAPLKWPTSVRVALLMSTLATSARVDVGDRVVEQLDDVLGVVGERARILARHLVVVGRAQQARGPAREGVGGHRLGGRAAAVAVAVDEPVGIGVRRVADRRAVLRRRTSGSPAPSLSRRPTSSS